MIDSTPRVTEPLPKTDLLLPRKRRSQKLGVTREVGVSSPPPHPPPPIPPVVAPLSAASVHRDRQSRTRFLLISATPVSLVGSSRTDSKPIYFALHIFMLTDQPARDPALGRFRYFVEGRLINLCYLLTSHVSCPAAVFNPRRLHAIRNAWCPSIVPCQLTVDNLSSIIAVYAPFNQSNI
jgi:hypothetical protein